jgi:hypothetical protein
MAEAWAVMIFFYILHRGKMQIGNEQTKKVGRKLWFGATKKG